MADKIYLELFIFGLLLSLSFCIPLPADTITVPYLNSPTLDGLLENGEWDPAPDVEMWNDIDGTFGVVHFLYDSENLCMGVFISDSVYSAKDAVSIWADLDKDGNEDIYGDYRTMIYRSQSGIYDEGWVWNSEKCIPFTSLGIVPGTPGNIPILVRGSDYDGGTYSEYIDAYVWLEGENDWNAPCSTHNDCAADEYCMQALNPDDNECLPLQCLSYEEIVNHECVLKPGACYGNSDCLVGACDFGTHTCMECEIHEECANNEHCVATECVPVQCPAGEEVQNHECVPVGWCSTNANCADNKYCNNNQCVDVPTGSCGYVSNHIWHNYECCSNSDCSDDEECKSHTCEKETVHECSGSVKIQLLYITSSDKIRALVSGIFNCEDKLIAIYEGNCSGELLCSFKSGDKGGNCDFAVPDTPGLHLIYACIDKDGDGTKEFDYEVYLVEECESNGCEPLTWSDCSCEEGETEGIQAGVCKDNCNKDLEYGQTCECEAESLSPEQQDAIDSISNAEELIEEAEELGKDVSSAEAKLSQAEEAYEEGAYGLAKELAIESVTLIPKSATEDFDLLFIGGIVIAIVILGAIAIYFLGKK